jgi:hypothetical protein
MAGHTLRSSGGFAIFAAIRRAAYFARGRQSLAAPFAKESAWADTFTPV